MNTASPAPVASALARRAMATFPPARRCPMMPEPTTVTRSSAVPRASATSRRARLAWAWRASFAARVAAPSRSSMLRAAAARAPQGAQRALVHARLPRRGGAKGGEDSLVEVGGGRRELVEAPLPAPPVEDEPRLAQVRPRARTPGLAHGQPGQEGAYTEAPLGATGKDCE